MTMELKDYLPLYIGQKVWTRHDALNNGDFQALTVSINNLFEILYKYKDSKLILRELSDMTEEEWEKIKIIGDSEWGNTQPTDNRIKAIECTSAQVAYLLSIGMDLFGLIPAGLAVDKKTLNP